MIEKTKEINSVEKQRLAGYEKVSVPWKPNKNRALNEMMPRSDISVSIALMRTN